jgi:hypothetical protein
MATETYEKIDDVTICGKKNRNDRNIWKNTTGTSEIIIIVTGTYEKNKRRQEHMKK